VPDPPPIETISHVIQLSVAPVFLLSGIAALLNVLTNRLSRIVDRARAMEAQFPGAAPGRVEALRTSLRRLSKRARLASWGISLCAISAILISCVVIVLFVSNIVGGHIQIPVAILFVMAMVTLTVGLVCFLREIYLSTRYLRIGEPEPEHSTAPVQATKAAATAGD